MLESVPPVPIDLLRKANSIIFERVRPGDDPAPALVAALSNRYTDAELTAAYCRLGALAQFTVEVRRNPWVVKRSVDGSKDRIHDVLMRAAAKAKCTFDGARELFVFDNDELMRLALREAGRDGSR